MALDEVQADLYTHTADVWRFSSGAWSRIKLNLPGYFWTERASADAPIIGGDVAQARVRWQWFKCEIGTDARAEDLVNAVDAGSRTGLWFSVRSVDQNDGANEQMLELEPQLRKPDGWSAAWP